MPRRFHHPFQLCCALLFWAILALAGGGVGNVKAFPLNTSIQRAQVISNLPTAIEGSFSGVMRAGEELIYPQQQRRALYYAWTSEGDGGVALKLEASSEPLVVSVVVTNGIGTGNYQDVLGRPMGREVVALNGGTLSWPVQRGHTYFIAIGDVSGASVREASAFQLKLAFESKVDFTEEGRARVLAPDFTSEPVPALGAIGSGSILHWTWTAGKSGQVTMGLRAMEGAFRARGSSEGYPMLSIKKRIRSDTSIPITSYRNANAMGELHEWEVIQGETYEIRFEGKVDFPGSVELWRTEQKAPEVHVEEGREVDIAENVRGLLTRAAVHLEEGKFPVECRLALVTDDEGYLGFREFGEMVRHQKVIVEGPGPFAVIWTNVPPGRYRVHAMATRLEGASGFDAGVGGTVSFRNTEKSAAEVIYGSPAFVSGHWLDWRSPGANISNPEAHWLFTPLESGSHVISVGRPTPRHATLEVFRIGLDGMETRTGGGIATREDREAMLNVTTSLEKGVTYRIRVLSERLEPLTYLNVERMDPIRVNLRRVGLQGPVALGDTLEFEVEIEGGNSDSLQVTLLGLGSFGLDRVWWTGTNRVARMSVSLGAKDGLVYGVVARVVDARGVEFSSAVIPLQVGPFKAPGNDDFENATLLLGESVSATGTLLASTAEAGEQSECGPSGSVWYRWSAPRSGRVLAQLRTDRAAWVFLYEGSSLATLIPAEPANGFDAVLPVGSGYYTVKAGQEYKVRVSCGPDDLNFELGLNYVELPSPYFVFAPDANFLVPYGGRLEMEVAMGGVADGIAQVMLKEGGKALESKGTPPWIFSVTNAAINGATQGFEAVVETREGFRISTYTFSPAFLPAVIESPGNTSWEKAFVLQGSVVQTNVPFKQVRGGVLERTTESWWVWTAPKASTTTVQLQTWDVQRPFVEMYRDQGAGGMEPLGLTDQFESFAIPAWQGQFMAEAGATYYLRLMGGLVAEARLFISQEPMPKLKWVVSPAARVELPAPIVFQVESENPADPLTRVILRRSGGGIGFDYSTVGAASGVQDLSGLIGPGYIILTALGLTESGVIAEPLKVEFLVSNKPLAMDSFSSASLLSGPSWGVHLPEMPISLDPGEGDLYETNVRGSVWGKWTAPGTGYLTIYPPRDFSQSSLGALVRVFEGTSLGALNLVSRETSARDVYDFQVEAGREYRIAIVFHSPLVPIPVDYLGIFEPVEHAGLLRGEQRVEGGMDLVLRGRVGASYLLQQSTDLVNWEDVYPVNLVAGELRIEMMSGTGMQRFYRALLRSH